MNPRLIKFLKIFGALSGIALMVIGYFLLMSYLATNFGMIGVWALTSFIAIFALSIALVFEDE